MHSPQAYVNIKKNGGKRCHLKFWYLLCIYCPVCLVLPSTATAPCFGHDHRCGAIPLERQRGISPVPSSHQLPLVPASFLVAFRLPAKADVAPTAGEFSLGILSDVCCRVASGGAAPRMEVGTRAQLGWCSISGVPHCWSQILLPWESGKALHGQQDTRIARRGLKELPAPHNPENTHTISAAFSTLPCMIPSPRETPQT